MDIVRKRLSSLTDNIVFDRDKLIQPGFSAPHNRHIFEMGAGPLKKMVDKRSSESSKLNALKLEIDVSISHYFEDNYLRLDYLKTKAQKF